MKQSFKIFLLTISQCFQINSGPKTNIKNDIVQQKKSPNKDKYEQKISLLKKMLETSEKEKDQLIKKIDSMKRTREDSSQSLTSNESSKNRSKKKPKIDVFFTPETDCTQIIVDNINKAKSKILVQAYIFTSKPIIDALIKAHKRGVKTTVLLDQGQEYSTQSIKVKNAGLAVYIDTIKGLAHNKVIIIDEKKAFSGSFNLSEAAQKRNAENLTITTKTKTVKKYIGNFKSRLANKSREFIIIPLDTQIKKLKNLIQEIDKANNLKTKINITTVESLINTPHEICNDILKQLNGTGAKNKKHMKEIKDEIPKIINQKLEGKMENLIKNYKDNTKKETVRKKQSPLNKAKRRITSYTKTIQKIQEKLNSNNP